MEEATAYNFSKGIRQAKKRYIILAVMLPIVLVVFLFLSPMSKSLSPTTIAGVGLFTFILAGLTFYFSATRTLQKLSELSVYMFPNRLERSSAKEKEAFFWKDLLNAEIIEYPNGETVGIRLSFANKKAITLAGFENMEAASKQLEQYIPDKNLIYRKRTKVNWDSPAIMIFSGILTLVIILAIQEIGIVTYQFFNVILSFAVGLYILIARPISRAQGKGRKKFETISGIVLIICSIFLLAIQLIIVLVLK